LVLIVTQHASALWVTILSLMQDGSDVLQFQRFRVFHPLPKQAHHGILKTLWDKRVQWNQGLNARRTKQLLQAFLDQDVRLGIPSQARATAPRPAVTAAPTAAAAAATLPVLPAASSAAAAPTTAAAAPATAAAAKPSLAAAPASPARTPTTAADTATTAEAAAQPQAKAGALSPAVGGATVAGRASASAQSPHASPVRSGTLDSSNTAHIPSPATTPVSKPMHQKKGQRAAASRKLALSSSPGQAETAPPAVTPRPDFTPLTPTSTQDQSDALHAIPGFDDVPLEAFQLQSGDLDHMPGDDLSDLPDLPPLHLSKAQHRSVRTDDGEEVHVLVSPVRSQGGDDSPSSPSRLPDSVLKAMCNMGKAFLSRYGVVLLLHV
jgi:hypothetical protein